MFHSSLDYSAIVRSKPYICKTAKFCTNSTNLKLFCSDCPFEDRIPYNSETELELHRQHDGCVYKEGVNINNLCLVCGKVFESNLKEHILIHHLCSSKDALRVEREIFACHICKNIFFNKSMLEVHIMYHSFKEAGQIKINCPLCSLRMLVTSIQSHLQKVNRVTSCPICLYKQPTVKQKIAHLDTHKKYFKCDCCQYHTLKSKCFDEHLVKCIRQTRNKIKIFPNIEKFSIGGHRPKHWRYKMPLITKGLNLLGMLKICVLCRHICKSNEELIEHLNLVHCDDDTTHPKRWVKVCSCGMEFSKAILLKQHLFKMGGSHKITVRNTES